MKKLLSLLTVFTLMFVIVGCTADKEENNEKAADTKKEENTTELTKQVQSKMYNAARVAEGKVNAVFAHDVAADGETPIVTTSFADESATLEFLSKYYSEDVAKEIYTYYVTGEKTAEGQAIVKAEPFFTHPLLDTTLEDVTIEGDANKGTIKTTENVTYTVELKDDKYFVTDVQ
ncbi:endonuclease [Bacillus sp. CGMCC 1.16607]|uniref:endonuclease n=1 Tax=Bacillus sp. CGMCC 1.16607 TaxID=3351842 RepID=UPI0036423F52